MAFYETKGRLNFISAEGTAALAQWDKIVSPHRLSVAEPGGGPGYYQDDFLPELLAAPIYDPIQLEVRYGLPFPGEQVSNKMIQALAAGCAVLVRNTVAYATKPPPTEFTGSQVDVVFTRKWQVVAAYTQAGSTHCIVDAPPELIQQTQNELAKLAGEVPPTPGYPQIRPTAIFPLQVKPLPMVQPLVPGAPPPVPVAAPAKAAVNWPVIGLIVGGTLVLLLAIPAIARMT